MELFESLINWATMIAVQQSTLGKRDAKKKKKKIWLPFEV